MSDATAIVLTVATPVLSIINGVLTNVIPTAASALNHILSVQAVENGGGNNVASIVKPITSAAIPAVANVVNAVPQVFQALGGNILKEAANPAMTGMSTATSMTSPVMGDTSGVVTVTNVISVVTVFMPTPHPTTSM